MGLPTIITGDILNMSQCSHITYVVPIASYSRYVANIYRIANWQIKIMMELIFWNKTGLIVINRLIVWVFNHSTEFVIVCEK